MSPSFLRVALVSSVLVLAVLSASLAGQQGQRSDAAAGDVSATVAAATAEFERALEALVAAKAAVPEADGPARLSGRVVDGAGEPLAGVTVAAYHWPSKKLTQPGIDPKEWLEAHQDAPVWGLQGRYVVDTLVRATERHRRTVTDADGAFDFGGVADGRYELRLFSSTHLMEERRVEAGAPVVLVAAKIHRHVLDLRLPDGTQPGHALVSVKGRDRFSGSWKWTPAEPWFPSEMAVTTVSITSGDVEFIGLEPIGKFGLSSKVVDARGGQPQRLDLERRTVLRVAIVGSAKDDKGFRSKGELVQSGTGKRIELANIDSRALVVDGLVPGEYTLELGRVGRLPEVEEELTVSHGWNDLEVDLGAVDAEQFMVVTCLSPEGEPVTDVDWITFTVDDGKVRGSGAVSSVKKGRGVLWIDPADVGRYFPEPPERVTMTFSSEFYGRVQRDVRVGPGAFEVTFKDACELVVVVDGDLHGGMQLVLKQRKEGGRWREVHSADIPQDGRVPMGRVRPGQIMLEVFPGRFKSRAAVLRDRFEVEEGPREIQMIAPRVHDVAIDDRGAPSESLYRLRFLDPKTGRWTERKETPFLDDEGFVQIRALPAGKYRITRHDPTFPDELTFELPGEGLTFASIEPTGWAVSAVPEGSLAQTLGLEVGDLLRSVDGTKAIEPDFPARLTAELGDGKIEVLISRNRQEKTLELSLGSAPAAPARGLGAKLYPVRR